MRGTATFFSWVGGIFNIIVNYLILKQGIFIGLEQSCQTIGNGNVRCSFVYNFRPTSTILWFVFGVFVIIKIGIMIYRQLAVADRRNFGAGILTLIFVNFIGGLLTMFLHEDEIG